MGGFTSSIRAVLDLDLSPFRRAASQAPSIAGEMAKQLGRKLGTGDVTKALLASLAIDAKAISETIASAIQGGSEDGWNKALDAARKYDDAVKDMIRTRMTAEQRIASIRDEARLASQDAGRRQAQLGEGEGSNWFVRNSGGAIRGLANRLGLAGAESESDAMTRQKNSATRAIELNKEAEELERKLQEERQKGITDYQDLTEKLWKTRRSAAFEEADNENKIRMIREDIAAAEHTVSAAVRGTIERREAELALAEEQARLEKEQRSQQKEADEKAKDALDDIIAKTDGALMSKKALTDATEKQAKAEKAVAEAIADRTAFSLQEAASGERGSAADQARARRILDYERRARRAADQSGTASVEDITAEELDNRVKEGRLTREQADDIQRRGGRNLTGKERSRIFEGRSRDLRGDFEGLKTSEKDPLAQLKADLKDALEQATTLKNIESYLQPVAVPK